MSEPTETPRRNDLVIALATAGVLGAIALAAWIGDFPVPEEGSPWRPTQQAREVSPVPTDSSSIASQTEPAVMTRQRSAKVLTGMELSIRLWLEDLYHTQVEWQRSKVIDENDNQMGEYALLGELSGICTERCGENAYVPAQGQDLRSMNDSIAMVHGYMVQLFLPDAENRAVSEASRGGIGVARPDPSASEQYWCCYAWPEQRSKTGNSVFFIDQRGIVLRSTNEKHKYSGRFRRPLPSAAYAVESSGIFGARLAAHELGCDGDLWAPIK